MASSSVTAVSRNAAPLADAPGGSAYVTADRGVLDRGAIVFAENCARCHSSKQPPPDVVPSSEAGRAWYRQSVLSPDFRENNFLSTDRRYPITEIGTNACRALGTNATRGEIWDSFSSETYKTLPPVGTIELYNPADNSTPYRFAVPAGGVGYYRPPSLIAIWSSAPFLHNNSVGTFSGDPSIAGRMRAFDDAIEKLLWPERRLGKDSIWRTTHESYLRIAETYLPAVLWPLARDGYLSIGPIPTGTPINLPANIDPRGPNAIAILRAIDEALLEWVRNGASRVWRDDDEAMKKLVSTLMSVSKCPDLVEDRGHVFGSRLLDEDKRALIEFLKML